MGALNGMGERAAAISLLPASDGVVLFVMLACLALTLTHTGQELRGRFWRYYGAIGGVAFPDALGFVAFFVGVTFMVGGSAVVGVGGFVPVYGSVPVRVAMIGVGFQVGAWIFDAWYSHYRFDRQGFRPNPGLPSAPYYLAGALVVAVLFAPGIIAHAKAFALGAAAAWTVFATVPVNIALVGKLMPRLKHEPWVAGTSLPEWAK